MTENSNSKPIMKQPPNGGCLEKNDNKIKSDGLSSSYYDIDLPLWFIKLLNERQESGKSYVKTEELIEIVFKNDFSFGTLLKSLVRAFGETQGRGKFGNNLDYELNKIYYYANNIRTRNRMGVIKSENE